MYASIYRTKSSLTSFTEAEKILLGQSFIVLRGNPSVHGTALYLRLFEQYPQYKVVFPRFKHISDEFLMSTAELKGLGAAYMKGMSKIVDGLNDTESLSRVTRSIARAHKEHEVTKVQVLNMCPILIELLKSNGAKVDGKCKAAWIKLFGIIAELIEQYKNSL